MLHSPEHDLQIIIVRPATTDLDEQGRITGSLDVPLSDKGVAQAKQLANQIVDVDIDWVYCGPTLAAQQTAVELTAGTRIKTRVDANLTNLDHGLWHGKEIEELKLTQPRLLRQWEESPETVCPPEGESFRDVLPRVDAVLKRIRRKHKSGNVLVIAPDPLAQIIADRIEEDQLGGGLIWQSTPDAASAQSFQI